MNVDVSLLKRMYFFFFPSVWSVFTQIAIMPFLTKKLDVQDYGIFAFFSGVFLFVSAMPGATLGVTITERLTSIDNQDRRDLITAALLYSARNAFLCGVVLLPVAVFLPVDGLQDYDKVSISAIALLVSIVGVPWIVAVEVLTVDGNAYHYMIGTLLQTVVSASTSLVCVFIFNLGFLSLFLAALLGNCTTAIVTIVVLYGDIKAHANFRSWKKVFRENFLPFFSANGLEYATTSLERFILTGLQGLTSLGLYIHAKSYYSYLMPVVNSVSRSLLPINIEEAKEGPNEFAKTGYYWMLMQLFVIWVMIFFVCFGQFVIDFLTNGKFTAAWAYTVPLIGVLLIQSLGKPQYSFLVVMKQGKSFARLSSLASLVNLLLIALLITSLGVYGIIIATLVRFAILRAGVFFISKRVSKNVPFQDFWALICIAFSSILAVWVYTYAPSFYFRLSLFVLSSVILAIIFYFGKHRKVYHLLGKHSLV